MVDVSRIDQGLPPKGGSGTAPPKPKPVEEVWVEPWKPWQSWSGGSDFECWLEWMSSCKSEQTFIRNLKTYETLNLYRIMNEMIYEIKRKNDEQKSI